METTDLETPAQRIQRWNTLPPDERTAMKAILSRRIVHGVFKDEGDWRNTAAMSKDGSKGFFGDLQGPEAHALALLLLIMEQEGYLNVA